MTYDPHKIQRQFERMFPNLKSGDMYCDDYGSERLPRSRHNNVDYSKGKEIGTVISNFEKGTMYFIRKIDAIKGIEYIGNHLLNDGIANFIQIKIDKDPYNESYFRAGIKSHDTLLEDFLKESGSEYGTHIKLIGGGIIGEAQINMPRGYDLDLSGMNDGYFVSSFKNGKTLLPDMMQINNLSRNLNAPIEYFETYDKHNIFDITSDKNIRIKLPSAIIKQREIEDAKQEEIDYMVAEATRDLYNSR